VLVLLLVIIRLSFQFLGILKHKILLFWIFFERRLIFLNRSLFIDYFCDLSPNRNIQRVLNLSFNYYKFFKRHVSQSYCRVFKNFCVFVAFVWQNFHFKFEQSFLLSLERLLLLLKHFLHLFLLFFGLSFSFLFFSWFLSFFLFLN